MPVSAWEDVGEWEDVGPAPLEGELMPRGPQGKRYTPTRSQRTYQNSMDMARGQSQAGEQMLSLVSSGAAGIAGLGTEIGARVNRLLNPWAGDVDPKAEREGVEQALTYVPRDPQAREGLNNMMEPVGRFLGPVINAVGSEKRRFEGVPILEDVYAAPFVGAEVLLNLGGARGGSLPGAASRTAGRAATASEDAIRAAGSVAPQARAAGFDVTPSAVGASRSEVPRGVAAALEGPKRAPEASLRNAQQLNRRLGDELDVQVDADGRLSEAAFNDARQPAFALYDEAKNIPGGPSDKYSTAVLRAIQRVDVPTEGANEVARLMQKYNQVGASAQLVEDLKNLRRTASKRREGDSANQVANEALADVQMAIADELENELGRRAAAAGDAGFQERLQQARLHLAQLYETERATTGGYVDAAQLAARQKKTGKLTGNLALGAHMGENLPQVFQHPQTAVPGAQGHIPQAWGARSLMFRMGERLLGGKLSRNAMETFNENIPFGPNALDEFGIVPVRERGYPSPMGPNAGPQPAVSPPSAPPGLFAQTLPGPVTPNMPSAGRPAPTGPSFNTTLADQMAGDLSLEGALPPVPPARAPGGRPLDTVDFERAPAPGEPQTAVRPALTQDELRLAPDPMLTLQGQPRFPMDALLGGEVVGPRARNLGRGIEGDFAAQLGPGNFEAGISAFENAPLPAMPDRPRGVAGPRSAQLSDPRVPGFELLPDTGPLPPPGPRFGPGDEFPGAAAPVLPQGPMPEGPASAAMDANPAFQQISDKLAQQMFEEALLERSAASAARPDLIGAPPGSFAAATEELALLPDNGPASPRVDITEQLPSQGTAAFPRRFKRPEAKRIETEGGYISYVDNGDGTWTIDDAFVKPEKRGQGYGQRQLYGVAHEAMVGKKILNSDKVVSPDQRRVYEKMRGKVIDFDGPFEDGGPVFRNIRPSRGK